MSKVFIGQSLLFWHINVVTRKFIKQAEIDVLHTLPEIHIVWNYEQLMRHMRPSSEGTQH